MGDWRYYIQRAATGEWLDTNAQIGDVDLTWSLSAPDAGSATVPAGLNLVPTAQDGRRTWERMGTMLYAEEDKELKWVGICTAPNPAKDGLGLEFIGPFGWLAGVPYDDRYRVWETNVFDVVRHLVNYSERFPGHINFNVSQNKSQFTVGDQRPPDKPKEPVRQKGETKTEFYDSKRYNQYQEDIKEWNKKYGDREPFEIAWWEAPIVGEEIDSLASESNFEYRMRYKWLDRGRLIPAFYLDLDDNMVRRREDIEFIDGMNIAQPLEPKKVSDIYANRVIALGAGEGRNMLRARAGGDDGRLYQAQFVAYKSIRNKQRLRALAQAEHRELSDTNPEVDTVKVWDVPGFASISTLLVGDEVRIRSTNIVPNIDLWRRIVKIVRNPMESVATLTLEKS